MSNSDSRRIKPGLMQKALIAIAALIALAIVFAFPAMLRLQLRQLHKLTCSGNTATNANCLSKIWAHRVNSIERFETLNGKFGGFETDIVWDAEREHFFVYHPPLEYEPITLDSFLSRVRTRSAFWFDTRSASARDTLSILNAFQKLEPFYNMQHNAIIELYDLKVANYLAEKGYRVALNIDPQSISNYSEIQWRDSRAAMSSKILYVSQEDQYINFLETHFPDKTIITWSTSIKNYFNLSHLQSLVNNKNISVILVNVKSRHYK